MALEVSIGGLTSAATQPRLSMLTWSAATDHSSLTTEHALASLQPQAGSAEDWGSGVALPETVLRRATVTLENLSHVSRGDQEVGRNCCCLFSAGRVFAHSVAQLLCCSRAGNWTGASAAIALTHAPAPLLPNTTSAAVRCRLSG